MRKRIHYLKPSWLSLELGVLVAMVVWFFGRFLVAGQVLMLRDLVNIWCGYQAFYRDTILAGAWPLWQPYSGCGEPFLADPQSACLYPLSVVFLVLPLAKAQVVGVMVHVLIACLGTFALSRTWGMSRQAALISAIAFGFSTFLLSRIEFYSSVATACWFPLVMVFFTRWVTYPSIPRFLGLSILLSIQLLAGHPETFLFSLAGLGFYAVFLGMAKWRQGSQPKEAISPPVGLAAACALVGLLAFAQILPSWEAQHLSQRAVMDPELDKASLNPAMLLTLLFPYLYGSLGLAGKYWAPSCYEYWVGAIYIGILPVLLVFLVCVRCVTQWVAPGRDGLSVDGDANPASTSSGKVGSETSGLRPIPDYVRHAALPTLIGIAVFSLLYSMGKYTPFFRCVWTIVPILQKFRWPTKSLMCFVLALSCLSGFALDWLTRDADNSRGSSSQWKKHRLSLLVVLAFVAGVSMLAVCCLADHGALGERLLRAGFNLGAVNPDHFHNVEWDVLGRDCAKFAVVAPVGMVVLALFLWLPRWRKGVGLLLAVCLFADLAYTSRRILPVGSAEILQCSGDFRTRLAESRVVSRFLKDDPLAEFWMYGIRDPQVFHSLRDCFVKHWSIVDRLFSLPQETSFQPASVGAVLSILYDDRVPPASRERLLRMLNCRAELRYPDVYRYLVNGELSQPRVRDLPKPLPRAYVVGTAEVLNSPREVLGQLAFGDFDPLSVAFTDKDSSRKQRFYGLAPGPVEHRVSRIEYSPNRLDIDVENQQAGVLVVTDTWFPGWRALMNGKPTDIFQVNGGFRGIVLPSGKTTIRMEYQPATFRIGLAISGITLLSCLLLAGHSFFRHPRTEPEMADPQKAAVKREGGVRAPRR